jgi:hypothetical protein
MADLERELLLLLSDGKALFQGKLFRDSNEQDLEEIHRLSQGVIGHNQG